MALIDQGTIAADGPFQTRVKQAIVATAIAIQNESAAAINNAVSSMWNSFFSVYL